jgi:uncharacterized protein (DUF1501 family)
MLNFLSNRRDQDCEGATRREFLRIGALGATGLTLPGLLAARAAAQAAGNPVKQTSVVWVWLGGGPSHIETFNPSMNAPLEYRSVTGEVATRLPGVTVGGTFGQIAAQAHRMAIVRSFAHTNSGHRGGTHYVMTGFDNRTIDNNGTPTRPAIGSIVSRVRGANDPHTGIPNYVSLGRIFVDGPSFLGTAYAPFDPQGQALKNMSLAINEDRVGDRRMLLASLDKLNSTVDRSGLMEGLDRFEEQAFNLVLGGAKEAFDLKRESPQVVERYGKGFGEQMLRARRLCEAGCGFVTLSYNGWDMHRDIKTRMEKRSGEADRGIAAFVEDVHQRGLSDSILLVVTGEFGRTPKINRTAGRDHWAPLTSLLLAGVGLKMGQVVGESSPKAELPKSQPIKPPDLIATVLTVLGIDPRTQVVNQAGRPVFMVEDGAPIAALT